MSDEASPPAGTAPWLLLIHQLPPQPAYFRVKIWRRLQGLGAMAIKSSVYALPATEQAQEDFRWLLQEIVAAGGDASICEARLVDGLSDQEVRAMFNAARDEDYERVREQLQALADQIGQGTERRDEARRQLPRLRRQFAQIMQIDFFGAGGQQPTAAGLDTLEARLAEGEPDGAEAAALPALTNLRGRTWVTREHVHVDRIASAWLIRRFIDPEARFKLVPAQGYAPSSDELRFDMFDAEFTHDGDRCTFEVLLDRAGLDDAALSSIAEIVHDIDLKDGKFGREETAGIASLIAGLALTQSDDGERLARGASIFEDLYAYFQKARPV
jgi:hypothetical protein